MSVWLKATFLGAVLAALAAPAALFATSSIDFPGLPWATSNRGAVETAVSARREARVDGAVLRLTGVYGDPEQTVFAYEIEGRSGDAESGAIADKPRLVLQDGSIVPLVWNATDPSRPRVGTLVFAGLPEGLTSATLEVDALTFQTGDVRKRFSIALEIDNRATYAASTKVVETRRLGSGKSAITITEISRTPAIVVLRGTFDGLTPDEIQAMGRPRFALIGADGSRYETESGRFGFRDGYRNFEFRFPSANPGASTLELTGLAGSSPQFSLSIP